MVFGLISLAATVPLLATSTVQLQETARNQQEGEGSSINETKTSKAHLKVVPFARERNDIKNIIKDRRLILKDGMVKLSGQNEAVLQYHPVTCYFLPFPNAGYDGLVTTIDAQNMLNWVYLESETYQVTYGTRAKAEQHLTGPMGLTLMADGGSKVNMSGWDGFMAVEEENGDWALYFDKDANGLSDKIDASKRVAQIELHRDMLE